MHFFWRILITSFLFLCWFPVSAKPFKAVILDDSPKQALWHGLYIAIDEDNAWSVQDIQAALERGIDDQPSNPEGKELEEKRFDSAVPISWKRPVAESFPAFGYIDSVVWAVVRVANSGHEIQTRLLSLESTFLDDVDMFVIDSRGQLSHFRSGNLVKPEDRWSLSLVPSAATVVPPDDAVTLILRVKSKTSVQLPLYAWQAREFSAAQRTFVAVEMLFYGLVISLVISQFIQFITRREKFSLWYVFTGVGIVLLFSALQGIGSIFVWGAWGVFPRDVIVYSLALLTFSVIGLGDELLRLKHINVKLSKAAIACQYFALSWPLWLFLFDYKIAIISLMFFAVIVTLSLTFIGVLNWQSHTRSGRSFTISWGLFFIAGMIFVLGKINVIDWSIWYVRTMQFAMVVQLLIFYYYQATSFMKSQELLVRQKEEALVLEKNYSLKLEHEIKESQAALKVASRQLEEFHIIDGLSGAFNRAYFNREFPLEIKRATREQFHLSLAVIDIVELNLINERYGYLAGDQCIRFLSETIAKVAQRDTDWHARFSDDSFVLVLPTTNAIDAQSLVQKIIEHTNHEMPLRHEELSFSFSVKIAFVSGIPTKEVNSGEWIDYLDSALIKVKQMEGEDFWSYEF